MSFFTRWFGRWGHSTPIPRTGSVTCLDTRGCHRMAYTEWGDQDNPSVVVCVHGLTRNGRDFDELAQALAREHRVVCPDVIGRGRSDWLAGPEEYVIPRYMADMVTLLARLDVASVDWVGTSMGGLIGMSLAALRNSPIRRLVLNDVGPFIEGAALRRIGEYVGKAPLFDSIDAAEIYLRRVCEGFGPMDDEAWARLTRRSLQARPDGRWMMAYDPAIATPFKTAFVLPNVDLWPLYDQIGCPTRVLRGERSDVLSREVMQQMGERGPRAQGIEIPGVGHAPTLMTPDQIAIVREFLTHS